MKKNNSQWILFRGLARESRHWHQFPELLKAQFPEDTFFQLDTSGNGKKNQQTSPLTISAYMEEARTEILPQFDRSKKTYLIAISMGGMIALDWIHHYPQEISGAVLINTSFSGLSPLYHRLKINSLLPLVSSGFIPSLIKRELKILSVISNRPEKYDLIAREWAKYARENPTHPQNVLRQLIASARYHFPEQKMTSPILLLNSQNDRMVNSRCSEVLSKKTGWPLLQHPSAGHDLPLDEPEWTLEQIKNWHLFN